MFFVLAFFFLQQLPFAFALTVRGGKKTQSQPPLPLFIFFPFLGLDDR